MRHGVAKLIFLGMVLGTAVSARPQATTADIAPGATNFEDRMLTPPPVNGQAYAVGLDSEEHTNFLHYGIAFSSAYSDNAAGGATGHPVSDINYSVWPTISLDKTTARLHWDVTYAPGFTFYQRTSTRNEADQSAILSFQYRLSPHVTFSAGDTFQKSSSVFNQPNFATGGVFGGAQGANQSVIAPLADRLGNSGNLGITYQYSADEMIGAGGIFSNLHYSNPNAAPGLWDSGAEAGSAFYTHRLSRENYIGATYQYQRLLSYPGGLNDATQTHSVFLFYTVYPTPRFSLSFFGGPQLSETVQPDVASLAIPAFSMRGWTPAGGASLDWLGHFVSGALSYFHGVSEGGGLIGAVRLDNASASLKARFTAHMTGSLAGFYANNNVLGHGLGVVNGHTVSATAAVERQVGEHFSVQLGYSRLHQNYSIPTFTASPDTNREFISFFYSFARPLGR